MLSSQAGVATAHPGLKPNQAFLQAWQQALSGDNSAQEEWQREEGGSWNWASGGVSLQSDGADWLAFAWHKAGPDTLLSLSDFIVEVTLRGKSEAAGLSFGSYKDLMVELDPATGPHRLQVEVSATLGYWCFRVDGQLKGRRWWDAQITGVKDIVSGTLTFKALRAEQVHFEDLVVYTFQPTCQLSVIMTCYLFLQRLRLTLHNWCQQTLPPGALEILVVHGSSPDGTGEYLKRLAQVYPHLCLREVLVPSQFNLNKGYMVNRALETCRGEWRWLTDADCLFPPDAAGLVLEQAQGQERHLLYGERHYLTPTQTNALLCGRLDGVRDFEQLWLEFDQGSHREPWGYTQIVHRSVTEHTRLAENMNQFAHSDIKFAEDLEQRGVTPRLVPGLRCLHLDHPFSWYGTSEAL